MKLLLVTTAVLELGAGVSLLAFPSETVVFLLGSPLNTSASAALGRVAGAAVLALAVACWLAASDAKSRATRGLVTAMVIYNLGAAGVLAASGIRSQPVGVALWPAVAIHGAMTAWCISRLLRTTSRVVGNTS